MEQKKICSACGTENRAEFQFCKNCGARLPETVSPEPEPIVQPSESVVTPPEPPVQTAPETVPAPPAVQPEPVKSAPPFYAPVQNAENMSELDTVAAFVDSNGYEYAQKMQNMKLRFKKASWNWPVFLFGFLLGLPFVWFFYRKMYKQGTLVLLVSLAIVLGASGCVYGFLSPIVDAMVAQEFTYSSSNPQQDSTFVAYPAADDRSWLDEELPYRFENDYSNGWYDNEITDEYMEELFAIMGPKFPQMVFCMIALFVLALASLIFNILLAVFADNIYKNHCERKLALLQSTGRCDAFMLRSAGGTSTAAAVLTGILFSVGAGILSAIIIFSSMSSLFSAIMTASIY